MVRLSFLFQVPLHEVVRWPSNVVAVYASYLSKEPHPWERIEAMLAQLTSLTHNAHGGKKPMRDFMLWRDAWNPVVTSSDLDAQIIARLRAIEESKE